jgi:hypothetical protein
MESKTYKSNVDLWIAIILILVVVLGIFSIILSIFFGTSVNESIGLGITGIVMILSVLIFLPVNYTLLESQLLIRFGLFRHRINYQDIKSVKKTFNLLSSPALSLKRIEIQYSKGIGFTLISPNDIESFVKDLSIKCPHLTLKDEELT